MKRRILIFMLCFLLLPTVPVRAAAAGSAEDPLISRSYLPDTFLPQVRTALSETAARSVAAWRASSENSGGTEVLTLSVGQSVELSAGQHFTLLSGAAAITVEAGELIDTAGGAPMESGGARLYARCVVCEDSRVILDAMDECMLKLSAGAAKTEGCPFVDVPRSAWFYDDVSAAYRRGLVNGVTPTSYEPDATLTGAQCVKLAACMHQLWRQGEVLLENDEAGMWYRSYVTYALSNGLLDAEFEDYEAPLTRARFVMLFYNALPETAYTAINTIPDGAIPDLDVPDATRAQVYRFYRAGILTGYTDTAPYAEHAFGAESSITRAEVATIMNRMFDESARQRFRIS